MSAEKLSALVLKLSEKTAVSSIQWEETSQKGVFQTSFRDFSVQISSSHNAQYEDELDYYIRIVNNKGEFVDQVSDLELKEHLQNSYKLMESLYAQARRNALGADKAIDSILGQLDSPF